jgi:hypothetical protein
VLVVRHYMLYNLEVTKVILVGDYKLILGDKGIQGKISILGVIDLY